MYLVSSYVLTYHPAEEPTIELFKTTVHRTLILAHFFSKSETHSGHGLPGEGTAFDISFQEELIFAL